MRGGVAKLYHVLQVVHTAAVCGLQALGTQSRKALEWRQGGSSFQLCGLGWRQEDTVRGGFRCHCQESGYSVSGLAPTSRFWVLDLCLNYSSCRAREGLTWFLVMTPDISSGGILLSLCSAQLEAQPITCSPPPFSPPQDKLRYTLVGLGIRVALGKEWGLICGTPTKRLPTSGPVTGEQSRT